MKKVLWLIACLITMVLSVNAQQYYSYYRGSSYSRSVAASKRFAHSMKMFSIAQNARYEKYKSHISYSDNNLDKDPTSFMNYFVAFGFGIGGGTINPTGNLSHGSFDLDLICMNVLMSVKLGSIKDTGEFSFDDCNSLQFGILIPVVGFGNEDFIGRKHKCQIYVAPLIGFISADGTYVDGEYMHENTRYHHCRWWIDETTTKDYDCTEYGGGLMVRYGCGYLLGKFTNKSCGVSIGLCI